VPGRSRYDGTERHHDRHPGAGNLTVSLVGLLLTVLAGRTVPLPLPEPVTSRLRSAVVTRPTRSVRFSR
jgi:hypothetical protein